jgi:hypothetical protein
MKKQIKIAQNLAFDKETVAKLDESQLGDILGGGSRVCSFSCNVAAAAIEDNSDNELLADIHSCCNNSCNG